MTRIAIGFVVASAPAHTTWDYQAKASRSPTIPTGTVAILRELVSIFGAVSTATIPVGALLGMLNLKEPRSANRLLGAGCILAGVFGLALSP
jgi:hypothetical protein